MTTDRDYVPPAWSARAEDAFKAAPRPVSAATPRMQRGVAPKTTKGAKKTKGTKPEIPEGRTLAGMGLRQWT